MQPLGQYYGSVELPEYITNRLASSAWSALSLAIIEGRFKNFKYHASKKIGKDIMTPEAVGLVLLASGFHRSNIPCRIEYSHLDIRDDPSTTNLSIVFESRIRRSEIKRFYKLLIEGYLLGTNFVSRIPPIQDEHGDNQLEGELKRYGAKTEWKHPMEVTVNRELVKNYCQQYNLSNGREDKFNSRLGL